MPRTARRSANKPARLTFAGALAVAVLILGLLGMHALVASSDTAALPPTHSDRDTQSAAATSTGHLDPAGATRAGHGQHADTTGTPDGGSLLSAPIEEGNGAHGGGHDMGGALMMCLAVLAAALALLGAALTRSTGRPWRARPTFASVRRPARAGLHAAGPPPVWEFSVIRC